MGSPGPSWLDASFFEKILRDEEENEFIKVSNVTVEPAVAKGNNYLSDMYRAHVTFSKGHKGEDIVETSFIAKIALYDKFQKEMLEDLFATEISMMSVTLPKINQLLREIGMAALTARCLHIQHEAPTFLIFEDLNKKSFTTTERRAGLDLDHSLIALRKLAAFHASSIAVQEKDPRAMRNYWKGLVHKNGSAELVTYCEASLKHLGAEVAKWPELSPRIPEKIIRLADAVYHRAAEVVEFQENDFNVLNHGDFWINNLMFSYDTEGKPTDVMFVDFQACRYGTPAIDLHYFFGASPCDHIREHKREFLLREYHASLSNTMEELKCNTKAPSFDDLKQILKERAFFEVMSSVFVMSTALVEEHYAKSLADQMRADGTCDNPGYRSKHFRKAMTRLLPLYDGLGLLDR